MKAYAVIAIDVDDMMVVSATEGGEPTLVLLDALCLGERFHVEAIRVLTKKGKYVGLKGKQVGFDNYAQDALDRLSHVDSDPSPFVTVRLPGLKGDWVLGMAPAKV